MPMTCADADLSAPIVCDRCECISQPGEWCECPRCPDCDEYADECGCAVEREEIVQVIGECGVCDGQTFRVETLDDGTKRYRCSGGTHLFDIGTHREDTTP